MWSLYENNKFLAPLKFSNSKTQEDVVREVLDAVKQGEKIIFIKGVCGTGKSAIALNIAKKLGKTSVIVPIKSLQSQYKKDYENKKYVLKENGEKLKISIITGRSNHKCRFLEENQKTIPKIKKEIDAKLHDIFYGKREEIKKLVSGDFSANNKNIPCKIEIRERNWDKIKKYLKQNEKININDFNSIKDVKRMSIATICPYWCPVLPEEYEAKILGKTEKKSYKGLDKKKFTIHQRKSGCRFYEQFNSFVESDVIVFNSMKYLLESVLNRKPLTEVEIIDECDEFLDNFSNYKTINIDRLQNSLIRAVVSGDAEKNAKEIAEVLKQIKKNSKIRESVFSREILPLKATGIYDLFRIFLDYPNFLEEIDEESYIFDVQETALAFRDFLDESYVTFSKKEDNLVAEIVTTNLAKKFKEMADKNKLIVLMSGTLHSEEVLKNIFGLENFKIIEAETESQGRISVLRTGLEMDCKYSKMSNSNRGDYLKALSRCVEISKKPVLIHVNSFGDLPSENELEEFKIKNLTSREKLKEVQEGDKIGRGIDEFKNGSFNILFSTKCSRGIDFPGEQCNSIIFTKYPYPNVQDAFWKILAKTKPQQYWAFYKDKAHRELWQKIYRGLRSKKDHVYVLSPDSRVLEEFEKK
ncbi:MAG: helicase C-terminal domain-containing protein [archaeon]